MCELLGIVTGHPTSVLIGVGGGLAAAAVLKIVRRVRRLIVSAVMLALTGGAGAGGATAIVHTLAGWRWPQ